MDDADFMGGDHALDDLPRQRHDVAHRDLGAPAHHRQQRLALDERHRQVPEAVDLADVVDADDIAMGDLPRELRLTLETTLEVVAGAGVGAFAERDGLDGDGDAELVVPGLVDGAHAAAAEHTEDRVAGQASARSMFHRVRWQ